MNNHKHNSHDIEGVVYRDFASEEWTIEAFTTDGRKITFKVDYCPFCGENLR